jgi:hypothetical protein
MLKWLCIIILFGVFLTTLLQISSNDRLTLQNRRFLQPVYARCDLKQQRKIDHLVSWHRKYNHPFLVERSLKIYTNDTCNSNKNDTRFACFIHLAAFRGCAPDKWREFAHTILDLPAALEQRCAEYIFQKKMENDMDMDMDMDIIWGLDVAAQKEKIYLESPQKGLIESFVIDQNSRQIVQTYRYVKQPAVEGARFAFMYVRFNDKGEKDSRHMALKEPLRLAALGVVYLISQNPTDRTVTLYYRPM